MGKHRRKDEDPEYIRKKIRRLQRKLEDRQENPHPLPTPPPPPSTPAPPPPPPPPPTPPTQLSPRTEPEPETSKEENLEDQIPEELLAALGSEGEEKVEEGEAIQNELATRWTRIMMEGLTKDQLQVLVKKYPTPKNFPAAVAPTINKEIAATLSELSINRDKRITSRQNMTAKVLSCLGVALTDILKGNINSKKLIEQINDAAKITANIFSNDSKSRKFFALSSTTKAVQDACRETKTGKFLFGDCLGDQLKAAQTITRTAAQIQGTANRAPVTTASSSLRHLNLKSPSHYKTTNQRGRGGHRPARRPTVTQTFRRPAPARGKPVQRRGTQRRY